MPCESCKYSVPYLHRLGIIDNSIFSKIIAGHKNGVFYNTINTIKPSNRLYNRLKECVSVDILRTLKL